MLPGGGQCISTNTDFSRSVRREGGSEGRLPRLTPSRPSHTTRRMVTVSVVVVRNMSRSKHSPKRLPGCSDLEPAQEARGSSPLVRTSKHGTNSRFSGRQPIGAHVQLPCKGTESRPVDICWPRAPGVDRDGWHARTCSPVPAASSPAPSVAPPPTAVVSVHHLFAMRGLCVWQRQGARRMLAPYQDKASRPQSGRARIR